MKALLLTNEYPPHVYGGAGVHVEYLSRALSDLMDVEVRCFGDQNIQEGRLNYPSMTARRRNTADHSIEVVGAQLRAMMPWIAKNKLVDQTRN